MKIIPAIDIKDGQCVRLTQGRAENMEVFSADPCAVAKHWEKQGAELIHIVDLDGAFEGKPIHQHLIQKIAQEIKIPIQVGGGIRDEKTIRQYLDWGIRYVVLGTFLLNQDSQKVKTIIRQFGNHLIAGIDVKNNHIAIWGWVKEVEQSVEDYIAGLVGLGITRMIYTDIARDGMLSGPNIAMIRKILEQTGIGIIASGGISIMDDLYQLQPLESLGLEGAIIGKALYKGKIDLEQAVRIFHNKNKRGTRTV